MIIRRAAGKAASAMAMAVLAVLVTSLAHRSALAQQLAGCGPSPVGATCGGAGPASLGNTGVANQGAGNPINLLTGNKYQREADMPALPGELGLEIVRHYNSLDRSPGSFGIGWRLSYDTELVILGSTIQVSEADGHRITFQRPGTRGGICVPVDPAHGILRIQQSRRGSSFVWSWSNGRILTFDASGKLLEIADGHGGLLTLTRGIKGELLAVTDTLGRRLELQYEKAGARIVAIRSPLGLFTYAYENHGGDPRISGLSMVTMADQRTIRRYHYEKQFQAGNPYALTGISVQFKSGSLQVDAPQRLSTYGYEPGGRAIWSMRGNGIETVAVGRSSVPGTSANPATAVVVNALGERTRHAFAIIGGEFRLLSTAGPGCAHCGPANVSYEYDPLGRTTAKIESGLAGKGPRRTESAYDGEGRLIRTRAPSVIDGKWRTTEYVYSAQRSSPGVPVARIDSGYSTIGAISRRTDYEFDAHGRLVAEGAVRLEYDALGRVASRRDADGATVRYEYDTLSRPLRVILADGRVVRYEYDGRGRVSAIDVGGRVERYEYDAADRLSAVVRPNGERLNYRYDAADRVAAITDARGNQITFGRDREGELLWREFHDPTGTLLQRREDRPADDFTVGFEVAANAAGFPAAFQDAGGYEYDDFGRVTAMHT
jgi:YD repeat-containing protein